MTFDIEKEGKKVELIRVQAAKAEMKYIIMQRQAEILRLEDNIKNQEKREVELKKEIEV